MRPKPLFALLALLGAVSACASADAAPSGASSSGPQVLDAASAVELLEGRDDVVIVDVRTPIEFAQGHLTGAELIDIQAADFTARIGELDPDGAYLVYCRSGNRSAHAVRAMAELGFGELYDAGGLADLARAGADVTR
jgi:phage shock protein E